ncbi:phosphoenolpyruvate carboxylase, partial [Streptomyces sp. SCA3-4]|uniref:phosphoenolpyruvate carboxylase n=1 Tax=Streptomyces sichuanensis TaxID=2871810 RepID=UPI001CE3040F
FHLANVTEQVHRGRALAELRAREGSPIGRATALLGEAELNRLRETARHFSVRPVFTAHPTEAARRSVLNKL